MVRESGCAVAKDRAGVASRRGDAPTPTTRTMLSKARTGEKAEPPVASSGPAALLFEVLAERNTSFCVLRHTWRNDPGEALRTAGGIAQRIPSSAELGYRGRIKFFVGEHGYGLIEPHDGGEAP
jgi:hypothetical protein